MSGLRQFFLSPLCAIILEVFASVTKLESEITESVRVLEYSTLQLDCLAQLTASALSFIIPATCWG